MSPERLPNPTRKPPTLSIVPEYAEYEKNRGIGLIAPFDFTLDRECWRWLPNNIDLHITRTPPLQNPAVTVDFAREVSDAKDITTAVKSLIPARPEAVVYACTSGSFVNGIEGEKRLRGVMAEAGAPEPITASGALVSALNHLGKRRVATVAPYNEALTNSLTDYLEASGFEVPSSRFLNKEEGIDRINYDAVRFLAHEVDSPDAEVIFLSCTNLRTYDLIEELEVVLDKPVLSANQVMMWAALKQADLPLPDVPQRLFKQKPIQEIAPVILPQINTDTTIYASEFPSAS